MRRPLMIASIVMPLLAAGAARAADRFFTTSDGVRLHYIDYGPSVAPTIVFVPGWTMPAWIFQRQIAYFSHDYHVIALDPRGQGDSDAPAYGYEPYRRGADIAELIAALGNRPVLLVGWSLGVLDSLAYVHQYGDARLTGMVLLDNSVGEDPPPPPRVRTARHAPPADRAAAMARFVRGMFRSPQPESYLDQLTDTALRTPREASAQLLAYPVPRSFWRDAIYMVRKPILYIVRPQFAGQAENLAARHPDVEADVWTESGHALFVDESDRFNREMLEFIQSRIRAR